MSRVHARVVKVALGVALLAAQGEAPVACGTPPEDCGFVFHGPYVTDGKVLDSILVSCEVPPRTHELDAYMERQSGMEWDEVAGRHALTDKIPSKDGFDVQVTASRCEPGWYRAVAHVTGVGPSLPDGTPGKPFDYHEAGPEVDIVDCTGGSP